MANEISVEAPRTRLQQTALDMAAKLAGGEAKAGEIVSKAVEVLAGANVTVTRGGDASATGAGERKTTGASNVPVLDNPGDARQVEANLAKLVAFLELDNEERQTEMAKNRIELQKSALDNEHENRMKEIDETIKKMKDAEKASTVSRIFGWIGAILAVAAAVALTVVTGGVAAGFAIAGAVLAVTSLVLNETGAMDSLIEKLAKHLESTYGKSSESARLAAALIVNLTLVALSLGCSVGGMVAGFANAAKAAADVARTAANAAAQAAGGAAKASSGLAGAGMSAARIVQNAVSIANTGVGAGALAAGGASTYYTHRAENAKADVKEMEKFIAQLQQRLDESQEELEQLLQQIESGYGEVAQILSSATDTSNEIANNLGQMA